MEPNRQTARCDVRLDAGAVRDFLAPRYVINGDGAAHQTGDALRKSGVEPGPVLVVCDRFLFDAGAIAPLLDGLGAAGFRAEVFADVTREPTLDDAQDVAAYARRIKPSAVVGVGGGSSMDLAKVAALLAANKGLVEDHIGADLPEQPPVPLALVPTTAGTGAETTRIAMLAAGGGKRIISHRMLVPLVAVLDVDLIMGLPPSVTSATGLDALTHATESFLSTSSSALSASMSLRTAELLNEWLPIANAEPDNRKARRATLYGAFLAGLGLNAGVVLGHSMAYTIANRVHVTHGVTCAMALPFCLAYNAAASVEGSDQLALRLTCGRSADLRAAADALLELNDRLGIPASLAAAGISEAEVEPMAHECVTTYPRPTNPVPMTTERVASLYRAWFARDLDAAWAL